MDEKEAKKIKEELKELDKFSLKLRDEIKALKQTANPKFEARIAHMEKTAASIKDKIHELHKKLPKDFDWQ